MSKDTELTLKEQTMLDLIRQFMMEQGYPPSIRDICDITKFHSTSSAYAYLQKLRDKGVIDYVDGQARTITIEGMWYAEKKEEKPQKEKTSIEIKW